MKLSTLGAVALVAAATVNSHAFASETVQVTHSGFECLSNSQARTKPDGSVTVRSPESATLCVLRTTSHTPDRFGGQPHNFHPQNMSTALLFKQSGAAHIKEASLCVARGISGRTITCERGTLTGFGAAFTRPDMNFFHHDIAMIWVHWEERRRETVSSYVGRYDLAFDSWDF